MKQWVLVADPLFKVEEYDVELGSAWLPKEATLKGPAASSTAYV